MSSKAAFSDGETEILSMSRNEEKDSHDGNIESGLALHMSNVRSDDDDDDHDDVGGNVGEGLTSDAAAAADYKNSEWHLFGAILPKTEVIFICQVVVLYIVILTCIVNLSLKNGDSNLWTALLSSSLGIMLPQPTLTSKKKQ